MNVLAAGLEWFSERPGGLPRYFSEYLSAWTGFGETARALVRTADRKTADSHPQYVKALPLNTKNPLKVRRVWRGTFKDELRECDYDVFNPHFAYYAWGWLNIDSRLPMVTHFHGPWAYESLIEHQRENQLRKQLEFQMRRWIEQSVYRRSNRFIVLSKFFQDELVQRYGVSEERVHIIPGAVDTGRFQDAPNREKVRNLLNIPRNCFMLLTVRRLVRRMGLDNLIQAVARLRLEFPRIFLAIVGGGPLYDELKSRIAELRLEDCVRLTNRISDDLLPLYYQAADLTVVPTVALEGFGFVTVESMACGTPVAGTPIGGTMEILEKFHPELLFAGATVDDLWQGLSRLLDNPREIPARKATRQHVLENYTWDVVIPQIREVFRKAGGRG